MFKILANWLRRASTQPAQPPSEQALPEQADSPDSSPAQLVPYDENLLERSRTQWQLGDWESLARLSRNTFQHHPDRAKLALLAAAGRLQIGQEVEARHFVRLAQEWGAGKKLIAQVLVAGAYNSLGKAAVIAGYQQQGLEYFKASVSTGIPGGETQLLSQARAKREIEQLGLNSQLPNFPESRTLNNPQKQQTLEQLYALHRGKVSDKWSSYLGEYDRTFSSLRNNPVRLLEVGVQNGGSLEIWSKYFINAQNIIGCDINPKCAELEYADKRISVIVGDINSDSTEKEIKNKSTTFDIIIDDGSHRSSDIVKTFARYYPYLTNGGIYIAEDLHCSYWQKWDGGLFAPHSSMAFFKQISDIINHEHWGTSHSCEDFLRKTLDIHHCQIDENILKSIQSIMFCNSLCIIRKESPSINNLQERFIAGNIAKVSVDILGLHKSISPKRDESSNPWSKNN